MALLMVVPALAAPAAVAYVPAQIEVVEEEAGARSQEMTRIYWRTITGGIIQFRVWSITNGRWLTDWTNL